MNQFKTKLKSLKHKENSVITAYAETNLPTEFGLFRVIVFQENETGKEHLAIIAGDIESKEDILIRVHSECLTGEVFHSRKCDCREQLEAGLSRIAEEGEGMVIYLRQEGRGIGLGNKIRAYALQESGHDTVDSNRMLGFGDDLRTYEVAVDILRHLDVQSVRLMTNNPSKIKALQEEGVVVNGREEIFCEPNAHSINYFRSKQARMGHMFDDGELRQIESSLSNVSPLSKPNGTHPHNK